MKNLLTLSFFCFLVAPLWGQSEKPVVGTTYKNEYVRVGNVWDYVYLQGMGGINLSMNEDTRSLPTSQVIRWGGDFSVGRELTPYWGSSLSLSFNQNVSSEYYAKSDRKANKFQDFELFINAHYNLSHGILGYYSQRKGNLYFTTGLGCAYSYHLELDSKDASRPNSNNLTFAFRLALSYLYRFSSHISLIAEGAMNFFEDSFSGSSSEVPIDARPNFMAGVRVHLGRGYKSWKQTRLIYVDRPVKDTVRVVKSDTVRIIVGPDSSENHKVAQIFPIFFAINSIEIRESERSKMDEMAQFLKDFPSKTVFILGHADRNTGNQRINYYLGKNRARVVGDELINHYKIKPSRIMSIQEEGDKIQPFKTKYENNRVAICIVSDLTE